MTAKPNDTATRRRTLEAFPSHWLPLPLVVIVLVTLLSAPSLAQTLPTLPARAELCDALAAYRSQWSTFEATYTVHKYFGRGGPTALSATNTDTLVFDNDRIFIERDIRREPGNALPHEHLIMFFDGTATHTVIRREDAASLVLITPGLNRSQIDLSSPTSLVGAWFYEFTRPLDAVLRDADWTHDQIVTGPLIDGTATILLQLSKSANVPMAMNYWLAPDRSFLPIRRELIIMDGEDAGSQAKVNECRVIRFAETDVGWFPMELEWGPSETPYARLIVDTLSIGPSRFDELRATALAPPANVNDLVHNEQYQLRSQTILANETERPSNTVLAESLATFLEELLPEAAATVRARTTPGRPDAEMLIPHEAGKTSLSVAPRHYRWHAGVIAALGAVCITGFGLYRRQRSGS